ncbi:MAG TPA: hypothetical protein VKA46_20200 [Gemmataceae bacterium]|nr:hypothetical protein [Gemmataceae bacterium]
MTDTPRIRDDVSVRALAELDSARERLGLDWHGLAWSAALSLALAERDRGLSPDQIDWQGIVRHAARTSDGGTTPPASGEPQ